MIEFPSALDKINASIIMNVLISQPNIYKFSMFLPNVWATLKTFCEQNELVKERFHWLKPIFINHPSEQLIQEYDLSSVHVLGLSCYVWNTALNFNVAERVKAANPQCVVIAGGPHLDLSDPDLFRKHPFIDVVVRKDGELPFRDLLQRLASGSRDFKDIPGLCLPGEDGTLYHTPGRPEFLDFGPSPIEANLEKLMKWGADFDFRRLSWETNRGCPYSCSFCDWGSSTMSRIRPIPDSRIHREIELFPQLKLNNLVITDGNFGILPRDLEIARHIAESKVKTGYPQSIIYSDSKNNIDRVVEIAELFFRAGLMSSHSFGLQHMDQEILAKMDRQNISFAKQIDKANKLRAKGIPVSPGLVLGAPGDTLEKLKKSYAQIMEMEMHDEYRSAIWHMLPGAPAWSPDYRDTHKLKTVSRYSSTLRRKKSASLSESTQVEYLVETSSYAREEWVEMYLFSVIMEVFHNSGLLRFSAMYFRHAAGFSYRDFYEKFISLVANDPNTFIGGKLQRCREHLLAWVSDSALGTILEEMEMEELAISPHLYKPEEYMYFTLMFNFDTAWSEIENFITSITPASLNSSVVRDLLNYQKEIMITPDYCSQKGKSFSSDYDWNTYFSSIESGRFDAEPQRKLAIYQVATRRLGAARDIAANWSEEKTEAERKFKYSEAVFGVAHNRIHRTYHMDLSNITAHQGYSEPAAAASE